MFASCLIDPAQSIIDEAAMHKLGESVIAVVSKGQRDAGLSLRGGLGIKERRAALEVEITAQSAKAMRGDFRWANALQQLADGLAKVAARQAFAETIL